MIIYKTEKKPFTIYNETQEKIIYHKEWIRFDIVEIGYYDIIFGIPWLYKYNPQIDWITDLISTI